MSAMDSSSRNASDMLGRLTLSYNRCALEVHALRFCFCFHGHVATPRLVRIALASVRKVYPLLMIGLRSLALVIALDGVLSTSLCLNVSGCVQVSAGSYHY